MNHSVMKQFNMDVSSVCMSSSLERSKKCPWENLIIMKYGPISSVKNFSTLSFQKFPRTAAALSVLFIITYFLLLMHYQVAVV